MTQKRTSIFTLYSLVFKNTELRQHFWRLNSTFCIQLIGLWNRYPKFFLNIYRFFKKFDLLFVSDVTEYECTNKKMFVELNKKFKTNPSSEPWDADNTKNSFGGLDLVSREPVFISEIFGVRYCWKFYHRRRSILKSSGFFLIPLERYSPIIS